MQPILNTGNGLRLENDLKYRGSYNLETIVPPNRTNTTKTTKPLKQTIGSLYVLKQLYKQSYPTLPKNTYQTTNNIKQQHKRNNNNNNNNNNKKEKAHK